MKSIMEMFMRCEPASANQSLNEMKSTRTDGEFNGELAKCGSSIFTMVSQMVSGKVVHAFSPTENMQYEERRENILCQVSSSLSPNYITNSNKKSNKYFTGAFTDRPKDGWILSCLLARRHVSEHVHRIDEAQEEPERKAYAASENDEILASSAVFRPKPSKLREMNFWFPTSF